MQIGNHILRNNLFVAPMAGVTDRPFRQLCKRLGAGMAVSEMVASNSLLWGSEKTRRRANHEGEVDPISVQIAGADPQMMGDAARFNVDHGAQIIDINMGCPAKKVCNTHAGSALLRDEVLVGRILESVVQAVSVPVTLKFRTGWDKESRNALTITRIAEQSGIRLLSLHGRTRACGFRGEAEYETIAEVKASLHGARRVPVVANGDIRTPQQALDVLSMTGVDAIMIGRAAQGRPWIFREIVGFIDRGEIVAPPSLPEIRNHLTQHLLDHYQFHGEYSGVRTARKHLGWYSQSWRGGQDLRDRFNQLESAEEQLALVDAWFVEAAHRAESELDQPFIASFPSVAFTPLN